MSSVLTLEDRLGRGERGPALPDLRDPRVAGGGHRPGAEVGPDVERVRVEPARAHALGLGQEEAVLHERLRLEVELADDVRRRPRRARAGRGSACTPASGSPRRARPSSPSRRRPARRGRSPSPRRGAPCGTPRASCAARGREGSSRPSRSCSTRDRASRRRGCARPSPGCRGCASPGRQSRPSPAPSRSPRSAPGPTRGPSRRSRPQARGSDPEGRAPWRRRRRRPVRPCSWPARGRRQSGGASKVLPVHLRGVSCQGTAAERRPAAAS